MFGGHVAGEVDRVGLVGVVAGVGRDDHAGDVGVAAEPHVIGLLDVHHPPDGHVPGEVRVHARRDADVLQDGVRAGVGAAIEDTGGEGLEDGRVHLGEVRVAHADVDVLLKFYEVARAGHGGGGLDGDVAVGIGGEDVAGQDGLS